MRPLLTEYDPVMKERYGPSRPQTPRLGVRAPLGRKATPAVKPKMNLGQAAAIISARKKNC